MQCPSTTYPDRIQDKPETTPPHKTGAVTDYFATAGVHLKINAWLHANDQFSANHDRRGVLAWYAPNNRRNPMASIFDGLSNTIMLGENAGREDIWRRGKFFPVAYTGTVRVRARGGAWATTDNSYETGQSKPWHASLGDIPNPVAINNSNEWGHCFYSFHPGGAVFAMGDGSIHFSNESISLGLLGNLTTRAGREVVTMP